MSFPVDLAHLLGIFIGMMLYGTYLAVFVATMAVLRRTMGKARVLHLALIALFILCTGYYSLAAYDIYLAFIPLRTDPGTLVYLSSYKDAIAPSKDILYMFSLLITDMLLIYRLWMVWRSNRYAFVIAGVLICAMLVVGTAVSIYEVKQAIVGDARYVEVVYHWTTAGTAVILCTNVFVTSCIAGRLWWVSSRQPAGVGYVTASWYRRTIFIVIQSGAIYCSCVIMQLFLYAAGMKTVVYLFLHISPAVVALTPTAIIFQLSLQRYKSVIRPNQDFEAMTIGWAIAAPPGEFVRPQKARSSRTLHSRSSSTVDLVSRRPGDYKTYGSEQLMVEDTVYGDDLETQIMEPDNHETLRQLRSQTMDDAEKRGVETENLDTAKQLRAHTL
ncbi:hypothetical protein FRB94_007188 [Tulasnella sp. JGI-2019a]|nr:hypothetical protein FRB94_007188 [Tulasnella sp. JGI-2019a]